MLELRWLYKYIGKKRHLFIIGLVLSAITSAATVINPMLSRTLIDKVITPQDPTFLLAILGTMLGVHAVRQILRYTMIVLFEQSSQEMYDEIRLKMYDVIENEDYRFYDRMRTGDLMTRMTNDLDMIRHTVAWVAHVATDSIVIFAVTITFFCTVNLTLAACLASVTPIIFLITYFFAKIVRPMYGTLRGKLSELNTVAQENIAGNRVVKAFAREEYEKERFEERNVNYRKTNFKITCVGVKFQPAIDMFSQMLTVITISVGGYLMIQDKMTAGDLIAFSSLTWGLAGPLRNLAIVINDSQKFMASCRMIMEVFYSQPSIIDSHNAVDPKERARGEITFKNVSINVEDVQLVEDINIHVEAGKTLGIMGTTGSGKTVITKLLMRFFEPDTGEVLLDGKCVNTYSLSYLRTAMATAMQDVFLFSDSIYGNISYGKPNTSDEDIVKYAKIADADGFISKMSEGYDTIVGERGVGLSGGQKQRLSLARAIAMEPSILILDDTTSAVDMETELYIQNAIDNLDFECTKIIIAQRVSSVQHADEIIIMNEGKITERGTHQELLEKKGFYYHIWALQNSIEEEGVEVGS